MSRTSLVKDWKKKRLMPAKKKAPKMTRGKRAAMVIDRWAGMELELAETKKQLAAAQQSAEGAQMALRVLNDTIRRHPRERVEFEKKIAAEKASVEFWIYEASRWRTEAEDLRRQEAIERVERGVS